MNNVLCPSWSMSASLISSSIRSLDTSFPKKFLRSRVEMYPDSSLSSLSNASATLSSSIWLRSEGFMLDQKCCLVKLRRDCENITHPWAKRAAAMNSVYMICPFLFTSILSKMACNSDIGRVVFFMAASNSSNQITPSSALSISSKTFLSSKISELLDYV